MFTETRTRPLVAVHLLEGGVVLINPLHIVCMQAFFKQLPRPKDDGYLGYEPESEEVGTMLTLSTGKALTVEERLLDMTGAF